MSEQLASHRHLFTRGRKRWGEELLNHTFFACALVSVITTVAVIAILIFESYGFFQQVPLGDFLFGTRWTPLIEPKSYGILPLFSGTLMIVLGSSLVALPIGLASAVYLSEYASPGARAIIKPVPCINGHSGNRGAAGGSSCSISI